MRVPRTRGVLRRRESCKHTPSDGGGRAGRGVYIVAGYSARLGWSRGQRLPLTCGRTARGGRVRRSYEASIDDLHRVQFRKLIGV
jgi:hypothetical protein